ncbi:MAG: hypothetical protein E7166_00615 [Firmicutes bacterium]|nr:hypothetical protein [Bacillota bacterium]
MKLIEEKILKTSQQHEIKKMKYISEKFVDINYVYGILLGLKNNNEFVFYSASAKDSYPLRDGGCIAECSSIKEIDEFIHKVDKSEKEQGADWEDIFIYGKINEIKIGVTFRLEEKNIWISCPINFDFDFEKFLLDLENNI